MLYMPSLFKENAMDRMMNDWERSFNDDFFGRNPLYGHHAKDLMRTDIKELDDHYELDVDLPGFKKDEIEVVLENGYLTINAAKGLDKDETDKETGKVIRQERYAGSLTRSFYVGEELTEEDIKAAFEDGVLRLNVPKKEAQPEVPQKKTITIE